jgi:hypothetical protein
MFMHCSYGHSINGVVEIVIEDTHLLIHSV